MSQYYEGSPKISLEFLALKLVHREPTWVPQLQCRFPPSLWFLRRFSHVICSWNCESLNSLFCLSNLGGTALSYVLPSLIDLRRLLDFSICSVFYLGRCGTSNLTSHGTGKRSLCGNFWLAVGYCECHIVGCLDLLLSFKEHWYLLCKRVMLLSEQLHFPPSFIFLNIFKGEV